MIGWIGAFDNEISDWTEMKDFLLEEITREEAMSQFPTKKNKVESFMEYRENCEKDKWQTLYGCTCGDSGCSGLGTIITKKEDSYIWTFGEEENELQFIFEESQYRMAFQKALKEIHSKLKS
ncbi:hypothetical protein [Bernardetia sp.]|uniref:hypothetical protein n=1 Tax=Bernardetia sp. TaxID=1937974 RepID=UPI0025C13DED|nr:hypothetical protein [Bernardetia sp.]